MLKIAFVLLSLVVLINAQLCPRNCSGRGSCVKSTDPNAGFICQCINGYTGPACGRKLACTPTCKNGVCSVVNGSPTCQCNAGFVGVDCGTVDSLCNRAPCTQAGFDRCVPILNGYICQARTANSNTCVQRGRQITCSTS